MANLELTFNPKKKLLRKDLVSMGKEIAEKVQNKSVDTLIIKITDDMVGGENSIAFPFRIVDKK